ncbi:conserved hypothetical protein [Neospora caninum Liverpool]|uniref:Putative lipase-like protein n=1 Tax=Neospora caninum (strain Liverpool) TaxID=572307 RepID=F0V729_NEOCL|nr:conserved hypothetical protein [Neospora caninum Liverpool]CBZ49520.1 conserved hypothetical protein [Neospora caninum Liverpool]CEL64099.1 TPA: putative lipase-like protein [Neospora caninum Liverpool]|eukprot:XP_003879555.1 conserved hypothetical protein [Neospora caninum Liverpool]
MPGAASRESPHEVVASADSLERPRSACTTEESAKKPVPGVSRVPGRRETVFPPPAERQPPGVPLPDQATGRPRSPAGLSSPDGQRLSCVKILPKETQLQEHYTGGRGVGSPLHVSADSPASFPGGCGTCGRVETEGKSPATPLYAYFYGCVLFCLNLFSAGIVDRMVRWCVVSALRFFLVKLLQLQRRRYLEVCCDPTQRFTHILSDGRLKAERHCVRTADGCEIFFYRLAKVSHHCCSLACSPQPNFSGKCPVHSGACACTEAEPATRVCASSPGEPDSGLRGVARTCRCDFLCHLSREAKPSVHLTERLPGSSATGPRPPPVISQRIAPHPGPSACETHLSPEDSPLSGVSDGEGSAVCTPAVSRTSARPAEVRGPEATSEASAGKRRSTDEGGIPADCGRRLAGLPCTENVQSGISPGVRTARDSEGERSRPATLEPVRPSVNVDRAALRLELEKSAREGDERPIVFLQHGLLESSLNWVSGGADSLAFMLVESGCDVWLGNNRGNEYVHLRPAQKLAQTRAEDSERGNGGENPAGATQGGRAPAPEGASGEAAGDAGESREDCFRDSSADLDCDEDACLLADCAQTVRDPDGKVGFSAAQLADWTQRRMWEKAPPCGASELREDSRFRTCSQLCCQCTGLTPFPVVPSSSSEADERRILRNACLEATETLMRLLRSRQPCSRRRPRRWSLPFQRLPRAGDAGDRDSGFPHFGERLSFCRGGDSWHEGAEGAKSTREARAASDCSTRVSPRQTSPAPSRQRASAFPRSTTPPLCEGQAPASAGDPLGDEVRAWSCWPFPGRQPTPQERGASHSAADEGRDSELRRVPPFSTISAASSQMWTFHDMATYDVPAMLQHILSQPARDGRPARLRKIWALGQSQGAAQLIALACSYPEVCALFHSLVLFSPPVILHPLASLSLSTRMLISLGLNHPAPLLYGIKAAEKLFPAPALSVFGDCVAGHRLMGFYTGDIAWRQRCINFKFTPSGGTSKLNFQHWLSIMHGGAPIGQFGVETHETREELQLQRREAEATRQRNRARQVLERVGETRDATPGPAASYRLENITCPVHAIVGGKDNLVNAEASVAYLSACIDKNLLTVQLWPEAGHLDFGWARARRLDLYPELVRRILSQS